MMPGTAVKIKKYAKPASYRPTRSRLRYIRRQALKRVGTASPQRALSLYTVYKNTTPVKGIIGRRRRPLEAPEDAKIAFLKGFSRPQTPETTVGSSHRQSRLRPLQWNQRTSLPERIRHIDDTPLRPTGLPRKTRRMRRIAAPLP